MQSRFAALSFSIFLFLPAGILSSCQGSDTDTAAEPTTLEATPPAAAPITVKTLIDVASNKKATRKAAIAALRENWSNAYAAPLVEFMTFVDRRKIIPLLEEMTQQNFGNNTNAWFQWIWGNSFGVPDFYPIFKENLYANIDQRFAEYFDQNPPATIRLDEIRWGGVKRDGIPPLKNPKMLSVAEATYLEDSNVVFGVVHNGDARAYPKRILAWHEMVKDKIGGEELNGVYCTLCGSMIVYQTHVDGVHYELGTSGFLYRSNKLMYDHDTQSLWSTLGGEPVVGPLVGKGIRLQPLTVVTTTWGEWKRRHPKTTVLDIQTGHRRDYAEGAAYRDYFATDKLMFTVPKTDDRLANKAEVFVLRDQDLDQPTAIAADFLATRPIYQDGTGENRYVILTDQSGANRAYKSQEIQFTNYDPEAKTVTDNQSNQWVVSEDALKKGTTILARIPSHRAFWFGWHAVHPHTKLIH